MGMQKIGVSLSPREGGGGQLRRQRGFKKVRGRAPGAESPHVSAPLVPMITLPSLKSVHLIPLKKGSFSELFTLTRGKSCFRQRTTIRGSNSWYIPCNTSRCSQWENTLRSQAAAKRTAFMILPSGSEKTSPCRFPRNTACNRRM